MKHLKTEKHANKKLWAFRDMLHWILLQTCFKPHQTHENSCHFIPQSRPLSNHFSAQDCQRNLLSCACKTLRWIYSPSSRLSEEFTLSVQDPQQNLLSCARHSEESILQGWDSDKSTLQFKTHGRIYSFCARPSEESALPCMTVRWIYSPSSRSYSLCARPSEESVLPCMTVRRIYSSLQGSQKNQLPYTTVSKTNPLPLARLTEEPAIRAINPSTSDRFNPSSRKGLPFPRHLTQTNKKTKQKRRETKVQLLSTRKKCDFLTVASPNTRDTLKAHTRSDPAPSELVLSCEKRTSGTPDIKVTNSPPLPFQNRGLLGLWPKTSLCCTTLPPSRKQGIKKLRIQHDCANAYE